MATMRDLTGIPAIGASNIMPTESASGRLPRRKPPADRDPDDAELESHGRPPARPGTGTIVDKAV